MEKFSYLKSANSDYIETLFTQYLQDPDSVEETWRFFFEGMEIGEGAPSTHSETAPINAQQGVSTVGSGVDWAAELKVAELIWAYRQYGKHLAQINPLQPAEVSHPLLELARFGLSQADLSKTFQVGGKLGLGPTTLQNILAALRKAYCGSVACEFAHISSEKEQEWLRARIEGARALSKPNAESRKFILERLTQSEGVERFLHTRYVAQKRFSVEGGEAVLPALDCILEKGAELGSKEMVLGMAHRGRLNVLVNLLKKPFAHLFVEFEGTYAFDPVQGEGDVKYHKGYSHDVQTRGGKSIHVSLAYNPSHLEFVNPVVLGMARAKLDQRYQDPTGTAVIPVQIHGDAAFAGQGVCYETLNMSQLKGYAVGGSIHIVINNQVGFTTSPGDARSTPYCTDVAKMLESPVFHVNGDDADAVWLVAELCTEYRQTFKKDCFIDLVCYRKHGHNEGDEPSFTQPLLYKNIKTHASPREVYAKRLEGEGVVSAAESQALVDQFTQVLMQAQSVAKAENPTPKGSAFEAAWKEFHKPTAEDIARDVRTAVEEKELRALSLALNTMPGDFKVHPKLERFFEARQKAVQDGVGIDWGNAEILAYGSLLAQGYPVRLTGQDVERGTFTHRHAVLRDFEKGGMHTPLNSVAPGKQALISIHNSLLSETGVMGFEYGYSITAPKGLVIWEAQFGDFANGAQVIIDQFIATSESKWSRMSGLVLLLPHGQEGQGPEHSSARLERFLSLCGRDNMVVGNFTTPAQIFHALRRQVLRDFRKPMVVMTPKSLLRHPLAVSKLEDLTKGSFQEVIGDAEAEARAKKIRRILLCTGKVYYDLVKERDARKSEDVAIVRVEQLYPWPKAAIARAIKAYAPNAELVWVQEEPRNMGAWTHVAGYWNGAFESMADAVGAGRSIRYVGRVLGASPAVGSPKQHDKDQAALVQEAFSGL